MNYYLIFIALIAVSIANVALAPFLLMRNGMVFPLLFTYLWGISKTVKFGILSISAFIGGLIIDILGPNYLGTHSLMYLLAILTVYVIEHRLIKNTLLAKSVSLVTGMIMYLLLIQYA